MLTVEDRIATLRLNRPDAGNAFDLDMARQFSDAVERAGAADIGVLLITGTGGLFCAGGDVRAMAAAADRPAFVSELAAVLHRALERLRELPVPIVAVVNGTAAGAGLGLVLAADVVLAARDARFVFAYGDVGLSPDCGVSALLPRVIGPRRAALISLMGQSLSAPRALEWQLVTDVCDPSALEERAQETAAYLAGRPAPATGETARLMRVGWSADYKTQLDDEAATVARMSAYPAAARGIGRFVDH